MKKFLLGLALLTTTLTAFGADKKISDLTLLPAASFATGDLLPIVDVSASETKKTTIGNFDLRYQGVGSYITGLSGDVSASGPGNVTATISNLLRSKLATGTANHVLINDGSGNVSSEAQLAVSRGGTALASGTSGGILGFTASGTLASSAALTNHGVMLGGGAGATPSALASLGTTATVLHGNASGDPSFSAVSLTADVSGTLPVGSGGTGITSGTSGGIPYYSGSSTIASSAALAANQIVLGGGAGTTPATLGSLGTTTTLLHGNAAGAPTFGAVSLTADVSGVLPIANGGTNNGSLAATAGGVVYTDGSKLMNVGAGSSGQFLQSNAGSAPTWSTPGAASSAYNMLTKTGNYTAVAGDYIVVDASAGAFTITLPTAVSVSGQRIVIDRSETTLANPVTVGRTSSQTIDGVNADVHLNTKNERWVFISDNTNWRVETHRTNLSEQAGGALFVSATSAYVFTVTAANATAGATYTNNGFTYTVTTTIAGGTTLTCSGNGAPAASGTLTKATGTGDATITFSSRTVTGVPAKGTTTYDTFTWWRVGKNMLYRYEFKQTGTGSAGSGDYIVELFSGPTIDVTNYHTNILVIGAAAPVTFSHAGLGHIYDGTNFNAMQMYVADSKHLKATIGQNSQWRNGLRDFSGGTLVWSVTGSLVMTNWED